MIKITVLVDTSDIIGVKETIGMYLERHGDVKIIDVTEQDEQMKIGG